MGHDSQLQIEHGSGRLLARFDSRLVIGVDVDQFRIETDRAFVEGDQRSDRRPRDLIHGDRDRVTTTVGQGFSRTQQKALQIVARREAGIDFEDRPDVFSVRVEIHFAVLQHLDERREEIWQAVAKLLHIGVLVG